MNGLVHAQTLGTPQEGKWGKFGGPRAYDKWIQRADADRPPQFPAGELAETLLSGRRSRASCGRHRRQAFMSNRRFDRDDREAAILRDITAGNFPTFYATS